MPKEITISGDVKSKIYTIRGKQVMIDRDLAELYQVPVKRLNEQVKRNKERFPDNFCLQLSKKEKDELVANCDRFEKWKYSSSLPYMFTEQGVAMLAGILKSKIAVQISIQIINAFVQMRKFINTNASIFSRIEKLEDGQKIFNKKINKVFQTLNRGKIKPKQGIFYNGQIFDAYVLVAKIIKSANKNIILTDNYVDETVLELFSKRKKKVKVIIYTNKFTEVLKQDLEKYNQQQQDKKIEIKTFKKSHDRFLIIDNKTIYHIGASLKDLGKKWFGFSKLEIETKNILNRLEK